MDALPNEPFVGQRELKDTEKRSFYHGPHAWKIIKIVL